jgi:hypothetical protein
MERWDREAVERRLMRLVEHEHPARWGGYHPVALDDTKEHRTSAEVWGTCTFHESAARSPNRAATVLWPRRRSGVIAALVLGITMLGKVIIYPFCNWLYEYLAIRGGRSGWRLAFLSGIAFATPIIAFRIFTRLMGMPSGWDEVDHYRFFVWVADYFREGRIVEIPWQWFCNLGTHFFQTFEGWGIPFLFCVCLAWRKDKNSLFTIPLALKRHIIVYVVCGILFWTWSGLLYQRLNICYFPAIIVLLGALAVRKLERPAPWLFLGAFLMLLEFVITNYFGVYAYFPT